ncbi:unnamed protein product, partial [Prorocentrum cordatum]
EACFGYNKSSSSDKLQKYASPWRELMTFPHSQMQRGLELIRFAQALEARLTSIFAEQMQLATSRVQAETTSILQSATSTFHNEVQAILGRVRQQDTRLDTLDYTVRDINQRAHVVETKQQQLRADTERIQASFAMAETTFPPLDLAALAVWDRPPDSRFYSFGAATAVQSSEVYRALEPWIKWSSSGHFGCGAGGKWRHFFCIDTPGAVTPLYANAERSRKTLRREVQTKKLAHLFGERHEGHFLRKVGSDGIVSCNAAPIVSVEVGNNAFAATQLRWDSAAIVKHGIGKQSTK